MALSKNYIDYRNSDEYYQIAQVLQNKVEGGEGLTYKEIGFFCGGQKFQFLRKHKFCDDEFFSRSHLEINTPEDIKEDPSYNELLKLYSKEVAPLSGDDMLYYESLIEEWSDIVNKGNHKDQLLQYYCTETREEIKKLKKEFRQNNETDSSDKFLKRRRKIIEFSKYRYIVTKSVFEVIIGGSSYKLCLNGKEILYNYYSLSHIITRHYGLPMKVYNTGKSHFTSQIFYEDIHILLDNIFKRIDESSLYKEDSINEINFKLNDVFYRVYCKSAKEGSNTINRIATFFPLEDRHEIIKLNSLYNENIVERDFSVYTKKSNNK